MIALSAQAATGRGTWSEVIALPADLIAPAARTVSLIEAATLPLAGLAAARALHRLGLSSGGTLVVTGAVGGIAVQLARHRGATVTALVSRPDHLDAALQLGASNAVTDPNALKAHDAVFDTAGVSIPAAVRDHGRSVTVGAHQTPAGLDARGVLASTNYVEQDGAGLHDLADLVDAGHPRLRIAAVHPLAEITAAHHLAERGGLLGKIVLAL